MKVAASHVPGDGWIELDRQARLKQARDPSRSWVTIDGDLWLPILGRQHKTSVQREASTSLHTVKASDSISNAHVLATKNVSAKDAK